MKLIKPNLSCSPISSFFACIHGFASQDGSVLFSITHSIYQAVQSGEGKRYKSVQLDREISQFAKSGTAKFISKKSLKQIKL